MRTIICRIALLYCLFVVAGCAAPADSTRNKAEIPVYPVNCIGVLAAVPGVDLEKKTDDQEQKNLVQGARVMNMYLAQEFGENKKVVLVDENYLKGLRLTGGEKSTDIARIIGENINCNAILETRIWKYSERVGNKWSVDSPASAAFDFRLIGTEKGALLWSAKFDETQVPVLENLYNWSKAQTRGFTWITAGELMHEGMREKLSASPYFKQLLHPQIHKDSSGYYDEKI